MALKPQEELPPGADTKWTEWKCLNRLRTGMGRSKVSLQKWGYLDTAEDVTCDCRTAPQTMQHLLQCPVLEQVCTADDLAVHNENAQKMRPTMAGVYLMFVDTLRRRSYGLKSVQLK